MRHVLNFLRCSAFFSVFVSLSCWGCVIDPKYKLDISSNAGCFLVHNQKVLLVRDRKSGKWSAPGGRKEKGEIAQCTAYRETLEETGLETKVGKLLKRFKNGFHLFSCELATPPKKELTDLKVPLYMKHEIWAAKFIDPREVRKKDWRFPKQAKLYLKWTKLEISN